MASTKQGKKLRILLIPFFANSHIGPYTDLAFHLAAARPGAVEATVAVTPANVPVVRSALARCGQTSSATAATAAATVKVVTYAFPAVDGLPEGVENMSMATAADALRINAATLDEKQMRPEHERLIKEHSPDAVITDFLFTWNVDIADGLGVPCVEFHVIGVFGTLAWMNLSQACGHDAIDGVVTVPGFPSPDIRVPISELPDIFQAKETYRSMLDGMLSSKRRCLGIVLNTFFDLEHRYCERFVHSDYVKRAYFVGSLQLPLPPAPASVDTGGCIDWLEKKLNQSVLYVSFGSMAHVSETQLRELALGLEASGKPFLWVVRDRTWAAPEGWKERVGDRGMVVKGWAPQTAILAHPAVGAFVTQCGWNSVLETVAAGVPVLTWPMLYEQFITERLVTEVLAIGERLWPEGAGVRSTTSDQHGLVPADAVASAVARFMEPGGPADAARCRVKELSERAHAAMRDGGSSRCDLHRLIDDLVEATTAGPAVDLP